MTPRPMCILLGSSAAIATALTACSGQSAPEWFRLLDTPGRSALFDMAPGANGNTLVVGATNHRHVPPYSGDALLLETDPAGAVVWERTWGGSQFEQALAVLSSDSGYVVFGETDSFGAGDRDFFLLKITEAGDEVWYRTYGTAEREWPYGMIRLGTGDLFLYGMTRYSSGGECPFAVSVSTEGDVVWEYAPVCSVDEIILDALETEGGSIVLALAIGRSGGLRALTHAGTVLWSRHYESDVWRFPSSITRSEGGFLLAGFSMDQSAATPQADVWLAETDAAGNLMWDTVFGEATSDDYAQKLVRLYNGQYVIGGLGRGMPLFTVDGAGHVLSEYRLEDDAVYAVEALIERDDGAILGAGLKQIVGGEEYDGVLFRLPASRMRGR